MNKKYSAPHTTVVQMEASTTFMETSWGNIGGTTDRFNVRGIEDSFDAPWDDEDE